jgi:hypothetical protein
MNPPIRSISRITTERNQSIEICMLITININNNNMNSISYYFSRVNMCQILQIRTLNGHIMFSDIIFL